MASYSRNPDIARRAFDAVANVQSITTPEQLEAAVGRELRAFGYELIVGFRVDRRNGVQHLDVLFGDLEHDWVRHYNEHNLAAHCPVARQTAFTPALWSELRRRPHTAEESVVFRDLDDFRLNEGLSVAVDHAQK